MNPHSHMYTFIKFINIARQCTGANIIQFRERFVTDHVYCYSRGPLMVCISKNADAVLKAKISDHDYEAGTKVCSIFDEEDCLIVSSTRILTIKIE